MSEKSTSFMLPEADDAPRITRDWARKAELRQGDRIIREADPPVRIGRPRKTPDEVKTPVSIRLAPRVLQAARASGKGWQSRAAAAIEREFLSKTLAAKPKLKGMRSARELGGAMSATAKAAERASAVTSTGARASKVKSALGILARGKQRKKRA